MRPTPHRWGNGTPMTVGVDRCPTHFMSVTGHGQCVGLFGHDGAHEHESALPMPEDVLLALNLHAALAQANGHKPTAAKILGLSVKTLYNRLAKLEPPATPDQEMPCPGG